MSTKPMKLVDPLTGGMECKHCGSFHYALVGRGGRFLRGSWQCPNGCGKTPTSAPRGGAATREARA